MFLSRTITVFRGIAMIGAAVGIVGCGGSEDADRIDIVVGLTADVENGGVVFQDVCAVCHGAEGEGSEGGAPNIQSEGKEGVEKLADIILNGWEKMPAQADVLTDQEVADVIGWIHANLNQSE